MGAEPSPGIDPEIVAQAARRVADEEGYPRWRDQVAQAHFCTRPVRITGRIIEVDRDSGRHARVYTTATEPDGVILKACGTRREALCPPCANYYRNDAFFLVSAGLAGGKGVPGSVKENPACFLTATAPSFGAVHRASADGKSLCRPWGTAEVCAHGKPVSCNEIHEPGDAALGSPICPDCYDYSTHVLFNAVAPELWRRTIVYLPGALARLTGMTRAHVHEAVRVSFVKVSEFQARGSVHVHAIVRLDANTPGEILPPAEPFSASLLAAALRLAVAKVSAPYPGLEGAPANRARWGGQVAVSVIAGGNDTDTNDEATDEDGTDMKLPGAVASYLANYVA